MMQSLHIGPLALPFGLVVFIVATLLALFVGNKIAKKTGFNIENKLYLILLVGLVIARLLFVVQYHQAYLSAPLSIFDIRDGGWKPTAGLGFAWLFGLFMTRKTPVLRRPVFFAVAVFSIVWLMGMAIMKFPGATEVSTPLPAHEVVSVTGESVVLTAYVGKPTIVNLWATWCPPCRREMPVLARAQQDNPDVNVVLLNQGESAETIQAFLDKEHLALNNVLLDPQSEVSRLFKQRGLPSTLFFDAQGRLVETRLGELSSATLAHHLAAAKAHGDKPD